MGTLVLAQVLRDCKLYFVALCSSRISHLGGAGQVDYCSANAFLDAYAHANHSGKNVISINWDSWQEVGMAANTELPFNLKEERERNLQLGILPEEGKQAFGRILGTNYPQVTVSPSQDPAAALQRIGGRGEPMAEGQTMKSSLGEQTHPRPDLSSDYVAPGNSTEQTIVDIWQGLLGVADVGIHDNFFELGGHSLLATGLVARLKSVFPVELSVASLFENPTVHSLSDMVRQSGRNGSSLSQSRSRGQMRKARIR